MDFPTVMLMKTQARLLLDQSPHHAQAQAKRQLGFDRVRAHGIDEREAHARSTTAQANVDIAPAMNQRVAKQCMKNLFGVAAVRENGA